MPTPPLEVKVGGINYSVTFNQGASGTIYDDVFGANGSVGEIAPTFKDEIDLAREARDKIVAILGSNTAIAFPETPNATSGNFVVPSAVSTTEYSGPAGIILSSPANPGAASFQANGDFARLLRTTPNNSVLSIATFSAVASPPATAVPTPALLPGLLGFGVSLLRKRQQSAS